MCMKKLEDYIVSVPDFPKPGILFRDVTGILDEPEALKLTLNSLNETIKNTEFDLVAGLETRGFLFGVPMAVHYKKAFVLVGKKGKLPRATVSHYDEWPSCMNRMLGMPRIQ